MAVAVAATVAVEIATATTMVVLVLLNSRLAQLDCHQIACESLPDPTRAGPSSVTDLKH